MKQPSAGHPLDLLFMLRPVLLVPVWTVALCGAASQADRIPLVMSTATLWALTGLAALFGGAFVINQRFDMESDRINGKGLFLPLGLVSVLVSRVLYGLLNLAGMLLLAWSSPWLGIGAGVIVLLGYIYSAPPWRLKDRAFPALFVNAVAHGSLAYLCGLVSAQGVADDPTGAMTASLPYFFAVGAIYLFTTVPDRVGDERTGKQTLVVIKGPEWAARWALGWFAAALLLGFYTLDLLFVLAALVALPAVYAARGGEARRAIRAVRWTVGALSVAICIPFPWYALVLLSVFLGTRAYYRWRFDLKYP